jgi:hypothetical protein
LPVDSRGGVVPRRGPRGDLPLHRAVVAQSPMLALAP